MMISTNRFKRFFQPTAEASPQEVPPPKKKNAGILRLITHNRSVCEKTDRTCRLMISFLQFAKSNFHPTLRALIRSANLIPRRSRAMSTTSLKNWAKADMESSLKLIKWHSIGPLRSRFSNQRRGRGRNLKVQASRGQALANFSDAAISFCTKPRSRQGSNTRTSCHCTISALTRRASCSTR